MNLAKYVPQIMAFLEKQDWAKIISIGRSKFAKIQAEEYDDSIILTVKDFRGELYVEFEKMCRAPAEVTFPFELSSGNFKDPQAAIHVSKFQSSIKINIDHEQDGYKFFDSFETSGMLDYKNTLHHYKIKLNIFHFCVPQPAQNDIVLFEPNFIRLIRIGDKQMDSDTLKTLNHVILNRVNDYNQKRLELSLTNYQEHKTTPSLHNQTQQNPYAHLNERLEEEFDVTESAPNLEDENLNNIEEDKN